MQYITIGGTVLLEGITTTSKTCMYLLESEGQVTLSYKKTKTGNIEVTIPETVQKRSTPFTIQMTYIT